MFGKGLITGLRVTLKHFFGKKSTFCYPEEKLPMTEHLSVKGKKERISAAHFIQSNN